MKYLTLLSLLIVLLFCQGCQDKKRYHDEMPAGSNIEPGSANEEAKAFQQSLNESFRDPETSPLPDRLRMEFESLEFFEPDSLYRVKAQLVRTPEASPFLMPTTTGRKSMEQRYGIVRFSLLGKAHELEIYQSPDLKGQEGYEDYLFLPFLDNTNGVSTYEGGRYLDLRIPEGDTMVIDFNKAYNPYCAYNKKYSCPIVPRVNYLDIEIRAGVKAFHAASQKKP